MPWPVYVDVLETVTVAVKMCCIRKMDAITLTTLVGVLLLGIERILTRFQCPGFHGFSHVDLAVSRCCHIDIVREQSPPTSPVQLSGLPVLERSVEDVIAQIASRRGSTVLSPATSEEFETVKKELQVV